MVKCPRAHVVQSQKDEIPEVFSILKVAIINQLHQKQDIDKELAFWMFHYLFNTNISAM